MVVPEVLQGLDPKLDSTPKSPVAAGTALMTTGTELTFDTVSTPVVPLVVPTWVLGNAIAEVCPNVALIPVPASITVCGLPAASEVTVTVPWKSLVVGVALRAVAVKVRPNVQLSPGIPLGASAAPEQVSDTMAKFGDGNRLTGPLGLLVVVGAGIELIWTVTAD